MKIKFKTLAICGFVALANLPTIQAAEDVRFSTHVDAILDIVDLARIAGRSIPLETYGLKLASDTKFGASHSSLADGLELVLSEKGNVFVGSPYGGYKLIEPTAETVEHNTRMLGCAKFFDVLKNLIF